MTHFHDVLLPLSFAFGGTGGPVRRTEVVKLASGQERRNVLRSGSLRRWDIGGGISDLDSLAELTGFFEARRGRLYGFRFRDATDWSSGPPSRSPRGYDQFLGTGDGARTEFPLVKSYGEREYAYRRRIALPVPGTITVGVTNGPAGNWSVESSALLFESPPSAGAGIYCGFQYDVPVRFDTDELQISIDSVQAGRALSVPLVELSYQEYTDAAT